MSILQKICDEKKDHIIRQKQAISFSALEDLIESQAPPRGFINAISGAQIPLIAEVKKASPSQGKIRDEFDPVDIAHQYQRAGAACLSVLTDTPYFQGSDDDLRAVRAEVDLPILRKDFMLDPYQIIESRSLGADGVLLIMAALSDAQAQELYACAREQGLDVLVEVHDGDELARANKIAPRMIGVNNRNLKTMEISIQTGIDLAQDIPDGVLKIAESGIGTAQDIKILRENGYEGFLIGSHFMRQNDIKQAINNLFEENN